MGAYDFESIDLDALRARPGTKWRAARPDDGIAAWVADMDFAVAPPIADAVAAALATGDLGYPDWFKKETPAALAFRERMAHRYGWEVPGDGLVELAEVVQGIELTLHLATRPGDGILLMTPVYPPFHEASGFAHRHAVEVAARWTGGRWEWDREELERAAPRARVLLLCHPHNPTGRVFERDELEFLADLAERHDLLVISDEIHSELLYDGRSHIPFASLSPAAAARTVTINSPSKPFNIAGLRWAVMHVGPAGLREMIGALPGHLLGSANLVGVMAAAAAWTVSDDWLDAVVEHLGGQRHRLAALLATHLPGAAYAIPESTYLAWIDCTRLGLEPEPYEAFREVGVELSPGLRFGEPGRAFVRLNFATSGAILDTIVERMATAVPAGS